MRLGGGRPGRAAAGRSGALWGPGHNPAAVFRPADSPLGKLRQGEIRPAHPPEPEDWTPLERSAVRLRSPWLREQLHLVPGVLVREEQGRRELAVPYDVGRPFPLTALFCFAHIRRIHGRSYAIFAFNGEERPVF